MLIHVDGILGNCWAELVAIKSEKFDLKQKITVSKLPPEIGGGIELVNLKAGKVMSSPLFNILDKELKAL